MEREPKIVASMEKMKALTKCFDDFKNIRVYYVYNILDYFEEDNNNADQ